MVRLNHSSFHKLIEILLLTVAIRSVAIGYCNKNFVAIGYCNKAFCYNKIFLLLLKTVYWDKNYCCYNLFQKNICCDRLILQ